VTSNPRLDDVPGAYLQETRVSDDQRVISQAVPSTRDLIVLSNTASEDPDVLNSDFRLEATFPA
jgi:hypothetical protein